MNKPEIPKQKTGASHESISDRCFPTQGEASAKYAEVLERLQDFKSWAAFTSDIGADFVHCDSLGDIKKGEVEKGDYIRINIPGPGNESGGGYDWVRVANIQKSEDSEMPFFAITIQPDENPKHRDGEVAHFYDGEASNTLLVRMEDNCVYTEVHGRNEKPNVEDASMADKARNAVVATMGIFGLSKIQWKDFTEGLLK